MSGDIINYPYDDTKIDPLERSMSVLRSDNRPFSESGGRETIKEPEDVTAMLKLAQLGWGARRIAKEFGCERNTVKRYLRQGGWQPYGAPQRKSKLDGLDEWLAESFKQHRGNADVVRQALISEHRIEVSLRTVERAVKPLRSELARLAEATVRFETLPGQQMQIDFGSKKVDINGELVKVHVFVATLGYSRRIYSEAFLHERQSAWFQGMESAFRHFGGVPEEILLDNAAPLVKSHNRETREVVFNDRLKAFCSYYDTKPKACAPYRARTKGKDERGVGYVKSNALAGHKHMSVESINEHLAWWGREISDVRVHGTTGEKPMERFEREERHALRPLVDKAPFLQIREVARVVATDSFIDIDTNRYSVPWKLIGETVTVCVSDGIVEITHAGRPIAQHSQSVGRHEFIRIAEHFRGIFRERPALLDVEDVAEARHSELLRPLAVYDQLVGGGWQ